MEDIINIKREENILVFLRKWRKHKDYEVLAEALPYIYPSYENEREWDKIYKVYKEFLRYTVLFEDKINNNILKSVLEKFSILKITILDELYNDDDYKEWVSLEGEIGKWEERYCEDLKNLLEVPVGKTPFSSFLRIKYKSNEWGPKNKKDLEKYYEEYK